MGTARPHFFVSGLPVIVAWVYLMFWLSFPSVMKVATQTAISNNAKKNQFYIHIYIHKNEFVCK